MAASKQKLLQEAWWGGKPGTMSPMEESRAWALREVWQKEHGDKIYGMNAWIASKVWKIKEEKKRQEHPTPEALRRMFEKVDNDPEWFPGKCDRVRYGPAPAISGTNQSVIARSAMTMKENKKEPSFPKLVAASPKASLNPQTGRTVDKKVVYNILRKRCYDDPNDPEDTWAHDARYAKEALTPQRMVDRLAWSCWMLGLAHRVSWYHQKIIWTDVCNSILPRTEQMAEEQLIARKGKKGWGSKKTKKVSKNLKGNASALKQKGYGTIKVWWAPILTRGKLHIEILGEKFPGDKASGVAHLITKVRHAVNARCPGDDQPSILFTDRGASFYTLGGYMKKEYKAALQEHSFTAFAGENASKQPGKLGDFLLHETTVSWIRHRESTTRPKEPWTESVADFGARMKAICADINSTCKVDQLCRDVPKRLQEMKDAEGDRINH